MHKIKSKITTASATELTSESKRLQKRAQKAFSENLQGLKKFTLTEMPKVTEQRENAMKGLEQLSNNVKAIIKK